MTTTKQTAATPTVTEIAHSPKGKNVPSHDARKPVIVAAFKQLVGAGKVTLLKETADGKFQAHCMAPKTWASLGYWELDLAPAAPAKAPAKPVKAPKAKSAPVAQVVAPAPAAQPTDRAGAIGSVYRRVYKGQEIVAKRVAVRGFLCAQANPEAPDAVYESLTSVVRAITGIQNPNGPVWFGIGFDGSTRQPRQPRGRLDGAALLGALHLVGAVDISADDLAVAFTGDDKRVTAAAHAAIDAVRVRTVEAARVMGRAVKALAAR